MPLPGANAALTALIASGLVPQPFMFYGFLARKKSTRTEELLKLNEQEVTLIFYEAPHRLLKTLEAMAEVFGSERKITLGRELTKKYEEFLRGTLAEAIEWAKAGEIKGEFVLVVQGNPAPKKECDPEVELPLKEQVENLITQEGLRPNAAIKEIAKKNGLKKQLVYNEYHQIEHGSE